MGQYCDDIQDEVGGLLVGEQHMHYQKTKDSFQDEKMAGGVP